MTQKIEDISTEEVMKAVKARDFGAIANLQWTVEVDYLKKMEDKERSEQQQQQKEEAKKIDEYKSDFEREEGEASALP